MSPRRSRRTGKRHGNAAAPGGGLPARLLLRGVLAGLALVLATPLVMTPGTLYPYVVGKAVFSRFVIEAVTTLWAVLALARPDYRPPRSWLLVSAAAGLAVSLLAAAAGVSFERSFWSDYSRMQGVIDDLHWAALLLVLVSTLRDAATWRRFLKVNLAVSSVVAGLAFGRYLQWDVPFYGQYPEELYPRIGGPLGNPAYLSGYLLAGAFVASGFAARALARSRRSGAPRRRGRRSVPGAALRWGAVAALHAGGFALGGSVASWVGLAAGAGFLCLAAVRLTRGRPRLAAAGVLAILAAGGAAAVWRAAGGTTPGIEVDAPVLRYVAGVHVDRPSSQARLGAWRAGLEGFTERPLLGWGPDNFHAPFNRFAEGYAAVAPAFDSAHNEVVEAAATAGVLGLAAWAATWCLAFAVVWRALGRLPPGGRALAAFVGAALAARLAQGQFWFDSAGLSLQHTLLLGFVAALEPVAFPASRAPRLPGPLAAALRHRAAAVAAAVAAVALAGAAATAQRAILTAANVQHLSPRPEGSAGIEDAIGGFPPMANVPRRALFEDFGKRWRRLRSDSGGARRILAWVDSEAEAALAVEPEYWEIRSSLARMYREVAATEADYRDRAARHLRRARELGPNRPVFPTALTTPAPLAIAAAGGGRRELRWQPAEGAAYHEVATLADGGRWRTLGWLYEPGAGAFVAPAAAPGREPVYAVRACSAERCGKWMTWPSR